MVIIPSMGMSLAKLLKVSLLLVAWLVFGGAYVLDALDASYEMNAPGSAFDQALEPEDKASPQGLSVSHAGYVETMIFCRCLHTGPNSQPLAWLFRKPPTQPLHQLLSIYRI